MFDTRPHEPMPVDSDEMSFAIALFVAAATGRIAPPSTKSTEFSLHRSQAFRNDPLIRGAKGILQEPLQRLPDEVHLACAVSVLWHHYAQDTRQQAMCSRLVAFYSLIMRRRRELSNAGTKDFESFLTAVEFSPAIAKAVATAKVGEDGLFEDAEFNSLVKSFSSGDEVAKWCPVFPAPQEPFRSSPTRLVVTEQVRGLSLQLLAFQSCVSVDPEGGTPQFRALQQLCLYVEDVSGTAALQAMLYRACRVALPEFAWFQPAALFNVRFLLELGKDHPAPTPQEAMKCEMTVLGSLIELLRSLVGDGVTVQLLRSLWPLANLDDDVLAAQRPPKFSIAGRRPRPAETTQ